MQMKIVVDTPEDYKKWIKEQALLVQQVKEAKAAPAPVESAGSEAPKLVDTAVVADVVAVK